MNHHDNLAAHRLLDANLNRAFEALRTLEDIARFQDQAAFQSKYKILRHQLRDATQNWSHEQLYASRNANQDVGRETKTPSEASRTGGLSEMPRQHRREFNNRFRCLEETSKFVYPNSSPAIEAVRYQVYDANAQLLLSQKRDGLFLKKVKLYVLVDCQLPIAQFVQRVQEISQAGVDLIQIRDKQLDAQELIRFTKSAIEAVAPERTRIIVNDRADILPFTSAFGLHVGQTDLSVDQARSLVAPACVVGLSTHDVEQVKQAIAVGADYIGCGPTFASNTKDFRRLRGFRFYARLWHFLEESNSPIPAFAIGGIDLSNLESVMETECGESPLAKRSGVRSDQGALLKHSDGFSNVRLGSSSQHAWSNKSPEAKFATVWCANSLNKDFFRFKKKVSTEGLMSDQDLGRQ